MQEQTNSQLMVPLQPIAHTQQLPSQDMTQLPVP